jgi:hypothetical protein
LNRTRVICIPPPVCTYQVTSKHQVRHWNRKAKFGLGNNVGEERKKENRKEESKKEWHYTNLATHAVHHARLLLNTTDSSENTTGKNEYY